MENKYVLSGSLTEGYSDVLIINGRSVASFFSETDAKDVQNRLKTHDEMLCIFNSIVLDCNKSGSFDLSETTYNKINKIIKQSNI